MDELEHNDAEEQEVPAEVRQDTQPHKDHFLPISILVAAFVLGGAIVFATLSKGGSLSGGAGTGVPAKPTINLAAIQASVASDTAALANQNQNAPVTLIEYGDYQCPFCAQFFSDTQPEIVANYIQTGKVKMVFKDFAFLGAESTAAAQAAQCATDQNQFWPYHEMLYASKVWDESTGGSENDGFYSRDLFINIAKQLGLDITSFTSCIDTNKDAAVVAQERSAGTAAGVNSTPTFFVGKTQILGAQPYSQFQAAIDPLVK